MLNALKELDPQLITLRGKDGSVLVSNALQGRIFAEIGGTLIHNYLPELAKNPDPVNFNNIGGNSLWPAPEGGDFAYNYPPDGAWTVQPGINSTPTVSEKVTTATATVSKNIELLNRRGKTIKICFRREIKLIPESELPKYEGVRCVGYRTVDTLTPCGKYSADDFLLSAWSLEQLPGAEGIIAFGRCLESAADCINDDFYGSTAERVTVDGEIFKFALGGKKRLQIALKTSASPVMIGSLDPEREVMVLRSTPAVEDGVYFNIADNDQPDGPFSASDMYSIFNGSQELNFHELETIAPMQLDSERNIVKSELHSTTLLYKGEVAALKETLSSFGIML